MSLENVQNFLLAAAANPVLANHIADVIAGKTGEEAARQFAALACGEGFDFTGEEALEALRQPAPAHLSDDELEKICGGGAADVENPYAAWMRQTAMDAEIARIQGNAAASAYESAFASTVPPLIIANRVALANLAATSFFGQEFLLWLRQMGNCGSRSFRSLPVDGSGFSPLVRARFSLVSAVRRPGLVYIVAPSALVISLVVDVANPILCRGASGNSDAPG